MSRRYLIFLMLPMFLLYARLAKRPTEFWLWKHPFFLTWHSLKQTKKRLGKLRKSSFWGGQHLLNYFIHFNSFHQFTDRWTKRPRYLPATRDLRRLDAAARSPIFSHFSESISGVSTIRAMQHQDLWFLTQHLEKHSETRLETLKYILMTSELCFVSTLKSFLSGPSHQYQHEQVHGVIICVVKFAADVVGTPP